MSPIQTYLDNIFMGLPKTDEMARARRRMEETMEEKYAALRGEGKSEAEALGIVVAEFGSVSELLGELGQPADPQEGNESSRPSQEPRAAREPQGPQASQAGPEPQARPRRPFPEEEYFDFRKRFAIGIAAGVCFCILGVLISSILGERFATLSLLGFFGCVAVGVALFIYFGVQSGRYEELKRACGWGEYEGAAYEGRARGTDRAPEGKSPVAEAVCSIIMCLATVVFLILGLVYGLWHPAWVVFPVGGILCAMISILASIWRR